MPSYPAWITVSNHALIVVADALRHRRSGGGHPLAPTLRDGVTVAARKAQLKAILAHAG